jgi:integrase/recombinase XerD
MKKKYVFTTDINEQLEILDIYLREKKYGLNTIRQFKNHTGIYIDWIKENDYKADEIAYTDIIAFIEYVQEKYSHNQAKHIIMSIKQYHYSIGSTINPVAGIFIKGNRKTILNTIVNYEEIQKCYEEYECYSDKRKRNKTILSLLLHQAITTEDIHNIEVRHIRLQEGKIYIPKTAITNCRTLQLDVKQILDLQEYLLVIRPKIIAEMDMQKSGTKVLKKDSALHERLFIGDNGAMNIKSVLVGIFRVIKKKYPSITSGKIIRATVIAEWLKTNDVRKVQYMAGHKTVSTTEKYNVMNLAELKDSLNKYHPLK